MTYPGQRVQVDVKVVPRSCIADPRSCVCFSTPLLMSSRVCASWPPIPKQSTYSSADFLKKLIATGMPADGIRVECVQTDNGFEFTNRFSNSKRELPTLFEATAAKLGHPPQAHPSLHSPPQRQGGTQPQRGPETLLLLPQLFLPGRFRKPARCPQPPLQQLPYETSRLAFSS